MNQRPNLAIVGATGAVGTTALSILSQRAELWGEIRPIASAKSAGKKISFKGKDLTVVALSIDSFEGIDIAIFDVPDEVSLYWAPIAASLGVTVIDNSAAFRMDQQVPLVVPEVNLQTAFIRPKGIIANPNCTTLAMMLVISALNKKYELIDLVVASYQAASGAGKSGLDTLERELQNNLSPSKSLDSLSLSTSPFPTQLALNVIPWAGSLKEEGYSSEEMKVRFETRKILNLPNLPVAVTCVRVPVYTTHSLAIHAQFNKPVDRTQAQNLLASTPGVKLYDDPIENKFPTPLLANSTDDTWVGRIRSSLDNPQALELFVSGDNLRKGAALNAIQIAELIIKKPA